MPTEVIVWVAVATLFAGLLLIGGFSGLRKKRLIENLPTSKVKGVFMGLNEVKGIIRCENPLTSFLTELPCVYYSYSIAEHYSYEETYTDDKGKTRTRTVSGWRTIDSGGEMIPFQIDDGTGKLRVVPDGAEIEPLDVMAEDCGPLNPLYYGKGPPFAISDSTLERRFTERALVVTDEVYVIGMAAFNDELGAPEIRSSKQAEMYMVSVRDEQEIVHGYALGTFFILLLGTLFAAAAPVGFGLPDARDVGEAIQGEVWGIVTAAAIYLGAVAVYYLFLVYNGLIAVRERFEMAESMTDVQLRRRAVLIPQLVTCVEVYAEHESESHKRVASMRTGETQKALVGLVEAYPELKADERFLSLQDELINTEDKITLAREFYNSTVRAYNDRILEMPDVLVAKLAGFRKRNYLS